MNNPAIASLVDAVRKGQGRLRVLMVGGDEAARIFWLTPKDAFPSVEGLRSLAGVTWLIYVELTPLGPLVVNQDSKGERRDEVWTNERGVWHIPADTKKVPNVWL